MRIITVATLLVIAAFLVACSSSNTPDTELPAETAQPSVQSVTEPAPSEIEQDLDTSDLDSIDSDLDSLIIE